MLLFTLTVITLTCISFSVDADSGRQTSAATDEPSMLELKAQAESDASKDVNKIAWGMIGASSVVGGVVVGGVIGGVSSDDDSFIAIIGFMLGLGAGTITGCVAPIGLGHTYSIKVPPERITGKSDDYVQLYTDTYKRKTRSIRRKYTLIGGASVIVLVVGAWNIMI